MHAGPATLLRRLVDHPELYSRNRFPEAWNAPEARRLRTTAALLRGLVRDLRAGRYAVIDIRDTHDGALLLLVARQEGVRREVHLGHDELAIVEERCPQAARPGPTDAVSSLP